MPEQRLERTRRTLPEGYQFGDASDGRRVILLEADEFIIGQLSDHVIVHRQPAVPNVR